MDDADECLKLDPYFHKAFYRRGQALMGLEKYALAIKDFEAYLAKQQDTAVINCLKEAREKLSKLDKNKFRKVQIIEEDDSD